MFGIALLFQQCDQEIVQSELQNIWAGLLACTPTSPILAVDVVSTGNLQTALPLDVFRVDGVIETNLNLVFECCSFQYMIFLNLWRPSIGPPSRRSGSCDHASSVAIVFAALAWLALVQWRCHLHFPDQI